MVVRKVGRPRKEENPDIDISQWIFLNPNSSGTRIMPDEIGIQLGKKKTTDIVASQCRLKIGAIVAKKLDIRVKDTLCFYSNPDDILLIAAVKRPSGNVIGQLDQNLLYVTFNFENRFGFQPARTKRLEYTIHKQGYLLFRIVGDARTSNIIEGEEELIDE